MSRRSRFARRYGIAFLLLTIAGCAEPTSATPSAESSAAPSGAPTNLVQWQADSSLLAQLAEPATVGSFQIQPPQGYSPIQPPAAPADAQAFAWGAAPREDGTRPTLLVMLVYPPGPLRTSNDVEKFLDGVFTGIKTQFETWEETPAEQGAINNIPFLRKRWEASHRSVPRRIYGFGYAAKIGDQFILINSQDVDPHHESALKLAETAALTFRKP